MFVTKSHLSFLVSFQSMLFSYAGFFFVPLTSRLVNDDSAGCRKLTALAIKSLLDKVSEQMIRPWRKRMSMLRVYD